MPVDDAIGGDRIGTSRPGGYDYHRGHPKAGTFICELVEIALKVRTRTNGSQWGKKVLASCSSGMSLSYASSDWLYLSNDHGIW
jgi:hypothetical protein